MKRTVFFSFLFTLTVQIVSGQAQSKFESARSKLGAKGKSINKEEYKRVQTQKFKSNRDIPFPFSYYQVGNMLINMNEEKISSNDVFSFKDKLRVYQNIAERNADFKKSFTSEIRKYGNMSYLVLRYKLEGDDWYAFFSEEYGDRKFLFGQICFNQDDSEKATALLREILSN